MTFSDQVMALTQEVLIPKVVDNVLNSNILALRLIGNAKEGKGYDIRKTIKYQNSGAATSFAGLDTFAAAQLNTKVKMIFDMRAARQPVAISGMDAVANKSAESQTDLVKEAIEETEMELVDAIGGMLYGDGTGNNNKDFLGLGAIVDDGTSATTIGGLTRSSYGSLLNGTRTSSGGTLTLAKLATLFSAISSGSGNASPTLMVGGETVWDLYEQLLTPMVREQYSMLGYYNVGKSGGTSRKEGLVGTQGFVALSYKGIPFVRDEKCPAQTIWMINENWLQWYGWDARGFADYSKVAFTSSQIEGEYQDAPMSNFTGFNWSGLKTPTNQFGVIADLILMGNLTSWQPRRSGRLTSITGV